MSLTILFVLVAIVPIVLCVSIATCNSLIVVFRLLTMKFRRIVVARSCAVVVGGDFARSPRMQYHATSLLHCGIYGTVSLVGVDEGNKLCEALHLPTTGALLNKSTLVKPPNFSQWFQWISSHKIKWLATTISRVIGFALLFGWKLLLAVRTQVSAPSLTVVGSVVTVTICTECFVQTPPAVPFVPLTKLIMLVVRCMDAITFDVMLPVAQSLFAPGSLAELQRQRQALRRTPRIFVDWHNFGFTLLKIDKRPAAIVALYKLLERTLCEGDVNITVSAAMKRCLAPSGLNDRRMDVSDFNLRAPVYVLYDAAPTFFKPCPHDEFVRVVLRPGLSNNDGKEIGISNAPPWFSTSREKGLVVVSATSWGSDDDYTMVVSALQQIDKLLNSAAEAMCEKKYVWLVVTGKGSTRARFEEAVRVAQFSPRVTVSTVYFQSFADYSAMLGTADIGLSVHFSSSGLDLPMKCVDMLGAGLPVIAVAYDALDELVTEKKGWTFRSAGELDDKLKFLLSPNGQTELATRRAYVRQNREEWCNSWNVVVRPLL